MDDRLRLVILRGHDHLRRLFNDFFQNLILSPRHERSHIRLLGSTLLALKDYLIDLGEEGLGALQVRMLGAFKEGAEKAGALTGVTGDAYLFNAHQERVRITIRANFTHILDVSRGLTFLPEFRSRSAPIVSDPS